MRIRPFKRASVEAAVAFPGSVRPAIATFFWDLAFRPLENHERGEDCFGATPKPGRRGDRYSEI